MVDLAVGVVIGAAFSGIVTQLTEAIIMPLIGWVFGDIDFSNKFILLGDIPEGYAGSLTNYIEMKELIEFLKALMKLIDLLLVDIH